MISKSAKLVQKVKNPFVKIQFIHFWTLVSGGESDT